MLRPPPTLCQRRLLGAVAAAPQRPPVLLVLLSTALLLLSMAARADAATQVIGEWYWQGLSPDGTHARSPPPLTPFFPLLTK